MSERKLAKSVVLRLVGNDYSLIVDGEEFPWHVANDPAPQPGPVGHNTMPAITVTLLAERLEVEYDLNPAKAEADA